MAAGWRTPISLSLHLTATSRTPNLSPKSLPSFHGGDPLAGDSPDYTIFVGDLAADVTDYHLQETFRARYSSVMEPKLSLIGLLAALRVMVLLSLLMRVSRLGL
ncbi:hypothetical protein RIF29_38178 [Crotalaria pallida]|uniref:Uncharacterized protein n=1 Tax=Crotalaria pallida TaxID=3830 RepID=A0AAN9E1R4_CROPI